MRQRNFDLLAIAGIFAAYAVTIRLGMGLDLAGCLLGAVANTVPLVIFGVAVRRIVVQRLTDRPAAIQLGAHLLLCIAFCALSYGLLIVLLGLFNGMGPNGFMVRPLTGGATAWQSLENVTTYALIAAISHLQALHHRQASSKVASATHPAAPGPGPGADVRSDELAAATDAGNHAGERQVASAVATPLSNAMPAETAPQDSEMRTDAGLSRYFVRIGEELRPLDVDSVVSINGADDYAEVRTVDGKHLVRVTLTEFARSLDPAKYVRVHRSWIVNTHRIASAEPAGGGRLLLHMETGQTISTSREGARLLRNRVL